jgi:tetratricopeptide (TPR) repeat protein
VTSQEERIESAIADATQANDAGVRLIDEGRFVAAAEELRKGLARLRGLPPVLVVKTGEAVLSGNLAQALVRQRQFAPAIELLERQARLARETKDLQSYGNALSSLGSVYLEQGDDAKGERFFEERLAIARRIGDKKGEGHTLNALANIYLARKQYGPAIDLLTKRVALAEAIGDRRGQATSLLTLGTAYGETSRREEAQAAFGQALELMDGEGDPRAQQVKAALAQL